MNLTLLKLISKILFIAVVSVLGFLKASAQEIDENYIFYSPSDEQMGHLSFINSTHHIFTNNENLLLMTSKRNIHLDTLSLQEIGFSGMLQYVVVIDDSTFSVGSYDNYALIHIYKNKLKVIRQISRSDLKKKNIKANMHVLLPEGLFTYDIKKRKKEFTYKMSFYDMRFSLKQENEVKVGEVEKIDLSNWAIVYPHQISHQNGLICLSLKNLESHVRFNIKTGKASLTNVGSFVEEDEAAEIFYDKVKNENYLVKYAPSAKGKARVFIYKIDLKDNSNYKLNDTVLELKKIRGGIHNGNLMLMDDFKGSLGFYLVPINELHKL